jgi:peptidoglycan/LPS O-acetylase OafA/YrhL
METNRKINPTTGGARSKILEFDILRSLAILLLFLHHGGIYSFTLFGFPLSPYSNHIALFLLGSFVFLSGYLSVGSLERTGLAGFLASRLVRIYLPYLAALAVFVGYLGVRLSEPELLIHLLGAQMLLSPRLATPVYTLWYIGVILAYSLIFGVLQKAVRRTGWLALVIVLVFLAAGLVRVEWGFIARRFFYYYFAFAAGVLCARTGLLDRLTTARFYLVDKLLFAGLGLALLAPVAAQVGQTVSSGLVVAISVYILSLVLLALSLARLLRRSGLPLRIFSMISFSSFFAYLIHRPVWQMLASLYRFPSDTAMFVYLVGAGSLVILGIAYLLQKGYDTLAKTLLRPLVSNGQGS